VAAVDATELEADVDAVVWVVSLSVPHAASESPRSITIEDTTINFFGGVTREF